jgi:hypothetical protein
MSGQPIAAKTLLMQEILASGWFEPGKIIPMSQNIFYDLDQKTPRNQLEQFRYVSHIWSVFNFPDLHLLISPRFSRVPNLLLLLAKLTFFKPEKQVPIVCFALLSFLMWSVLAQACYRFGGDAVFGPSKTPLKYPPGTSVMKLVAQQIDLNMNPILLLHRGLLIQLGIQPPSAAQWFLVDGHHRILCLLIAGYKPETLIKAKHITSEGNFKGTELMEFIKSKNPVTKAYEREGWIDEVLEVYIIGESFHVKSNNAGGAGHYQELEKRLVCLASPTFDCTPLACSVSIFLMIYFHFSLEIQRKPWQMDLPHSPFPRASNKSRPDHLIQTPRI